MSQNPSPATPPEPPEPPECRQAFEELPWLVNGSLPLRDARTLEGHLAGCARCRARLALERELQAAVRRPAGNVQQSPLAAWGRFEAAVAAASPPSQPSPPPPPPTTTTTTTKATTVVPASGHRRHPLRLALMLQAAAIAVLSVALLWVLVARTPVAPQAAYRTVAAPDATIEAGREAWRVVFQPGLGDGDVAPLLAAQGLAVLAGPTPDGLYTVVPVPGAAPRIDALRADPRVRLVEPVGPPDRAAAPGAQGAQGAP